jgi:hypothetical protein
MAEQTLESPTHLDIIDTSELPLPSLATLPESALKDALLEVIDVTRRGRRTDAGGFNNGMAG